MVLCPIYAAIGVCTLDDADFSAAATGTKECVLVRLFRPE